MEILEDLRGETALCPALLAPEMRRGCVVERLCPFMSSELQGRQSAHRVRQVAEKTGISVGCWQEKKGGGGVQGEVRWWERVGCISTQMDEGGGS